MRTKNKEYRDMDRPIMIFDGMNLAYTAWYAYAKLQGSQIIYGVPEMIRAFIHRYNPQRVIVVWDGKRNAKRLELLPTYKSHRKERPKGFNTQLKKVRRLLYSMGIPQVLNREIEGDDMVHLVVERLKKATSNCFLRIVSGDKDMMQLIDERTWVEVPRIDGEITTKELFKAHTSLNYPIQHIDYLCLTGDKSDDIPGYMGIGEIRAREFVNKWGSIKTFLAGKKNRHPLIKRKRLRRLWKRNRALIDLRYFCKKMGYTHEDITYYKNRTEPLWDEDKFIEICQANRLRVFQKDSFKNVFKNL